ncbi:protein shifted-like [Diadema setosum]|uniref:protein shifted-like n=1 Tax=Diadema setosum TaxID=31175 RepID=UPI003B3A2BE4
MMHLMFKIKRLCRSWSRCYRVGFVSVVFLLWLTLRSHETRSFKGLDVWLDHNQARQLLGVSGPYYFIQNDSPSSLLSSGQTRHLSTRSKLQLSHETRHLNISFSAPAGYRYSIEDVTTSNPDLLGYPLFSIPTTGRVPTKNSEFSVEFPCNGRESGTTLVSFRIRFQTENYDGQDIKASPLFFQIEKECIKDSVCNPPCAQGGECNLSGRCDCKDGYYGPQCRQVLCNPHCYNGGTCVSPGVCACTKGFSGKFCHLASCKDNCYNHGRCVAPGKCKCFRNWFGDICQHPAPGVKEKGNREVLNKTHKAKGYNGDSLNDFDVDLTKDETSNYSS